MRRHSIIVTLSMVVLTVLSSCAAPPSVRRISVGYAVHFTKIDITINHKQIDYNKRLQGPGDYYDLPSSPEIVHLLAAPLLESELFSKPQNKAPVGPAVYWFTIELSDGRALSRRIAHGDVPKDPKISLWVAQSHISNKFSDLLKGHKNAEPPAGDVRE